MLVGTLMAREDENPKTPLASKPSPNTKDELHIVSQASSSHPRNNEESFQLPKKPQKPEEFILSVASNIASQPLQYSDPDVWGVLTAISDRARKRRQGINMLLTSDEHCIGRLVDDIRFQILSNQISANHCKIYRKKIATKDAEEPFKFCNSIFLKDTSTNGTYLNWEKLNKQCPGSKLHHGDIISFAAPPQHELAYAFVFRDVLKSTSLASGSHLKRKAGKVLFCEEELGYEGKRVRGIGIGASKGPISLDNFQNLQRSNTELRKQLENQVITIDSLQFEIREAIERHQTEKKDLKESVSKSYLDKLKDLNYILEAKQKELVEINGISAEQKHKLEDINQRLSASLQSCTEANDVINSQKASISELKALLDEERDKRKEEREKALLDLKASMERVQAEALEELKRLSDSALRQEKEQQEIINKLQESEKEKCSLVENLRSKVEDTWQKLVLSDKKVRYLETLVCEEKLTSANARKRVEELEKETIRLRKELENEKAAREEARAKVSVLELEINAAMRDLDFERRRFRAARERIMLRETQLRAFYSTTKEISTLFAKQQEQLKAMQKTLEDEENCENIRFNVDPNPNNGNANESLIKGRQAIGTQNPNTGKANSRNLVQISSDEDSVTEKHECYTKNQEKKGEETQEAECTSFRRVVKGAFGSEISGVGTAPVLEGNLVETERVSETESQRNLELNKCSALDGDTMQVNDETLGQGIEEWGRVDSNTNLEMHEAMEDTEGGPMVKTAEPLALEVVGSWGCSTLPSDGVVADSQCGASDAEMDGGNRMEDRRFDEHFCGDDDDDDDATQEDTIG